MRFCGRSEKFHSPRTPPGGAALLASLETPPTRCDWRPAVAKRWQMWGNDQVGCCADAAAAALILLWTANAQAGRVLTTPQVLANYSLTAGWVPGDASTDRGTRLVDLLDSWVERGIQDSTGTPDVLTAYAYVDPQDRASMKRAIALFGGVMVGADLPDSAVQQNDWSDLTGVGKNGHCFAITGYDEVNAYVVTWAEELLVPWGFIERYVDEAYCLMSRHDWLSTTALTPARETLDRLLADFLRFRS